MSVKNVNTTSSYRIIVRLLFKLTNHPSGHKCTLKTTRRPVFKTGLQDGYEDLKTLSDPSFWRCIFKVFKTIIPDVLQPKFNAPFNILWICYEGSFSEFYLYMKPISFQSKASVVCSVTAAIFIDFCLKKLNVFSQHIGKKNKWISEFRRTNTQC